MKQKTHERTVIVGSTDGVWHLVEDDGLMPFPVCDLFGPTPEGMAFKKIPFDVFWHRLLPVCWDCLYQICWKEEIPTEP